MAEIESSNTTCCIVGGGPAGMLLGLLLARAGIETVVLEKHADFLRDFRGDTVHPSTLRILDELGLLDRFLKRPHSRLARIGGWFGNHQVRLGDFSGLPERYAFIAMMPQWEFLDFLAEAAHAYPHFSLRRQTRADSLITDSLVPDAQARVQGVRGMGPGGAFELHAKWTFACDGRHSAMRAAAKLEVEDLGAPIDVLWFRIGRDPTITDTSLARIAPGRFLVTIDRGDYWQCAHVVPKGGAAALQASDVAVLRAGVAEAAPFLAPRLHELRSWDDAKLLTVRIDRLRQWSRPGLLCIGDAAHAMSPVGGVGINLAIQDAVATANLLARGLRDGSLNDADLERVRERRLWPTRVTQAVQQAIQHNVLVPALGAADVDGMEPPMPLRIVSRMPFLQRLLARLLGMGVRPEHVRSPSGRT